MFTSSSFARSAVCAPRHLLGLRTQTVRAQRLVVMAAVAAGKKLYVGNLSWGATADDLSGLFSKYGDVHDAFIPTDRETGRSRGFGFVTLDADNADNAAAELNGFEFQGRQLRVNEAQPQGDRRGGGGFRGGRGGGRGRGGYGGGYGGGNSYSYNDSGY